RFPWPVDGGRPCPRGAGPSRPVRAALVHRGPAAGDDRGDGTGAAVPGLHGRRHPRVAAARRPGPARRRGGASRQDPRSGIRPRPAGPHVRPQPGPCAGVWRGPLARPANRFLSLYPRADGGLVGAGQEDRFLVGRIANPFYLVAGSRMSEDKWYGWYTSPRCPIPSTSSLARLVT